MIVFVVLSVLRTKEKVKLTSSGSIVINGCDESVLLLVCTDDWHLTSNGFLTLSLTIGFHQPVFSSDRFSMILYVTVVVVGF